MSARRVAAPLAGLVALSALLVATVCVVPYLPTNDGPEWVYLTHVQNHFTDPHTRYAAEYIPALQYAGRGFTTLYAPLEAWLGWERGLRVALSLVVLLDAWGFAALVYAHDARRWPLAFVGFPLALTWHFYMGFWAFGVGSGIGLFVLATALTMRAPTWSGRALVALLLFLQAVAHVFSAVLTGGVLALVLVGRAPRGERLRELGKALLVGLPAAGVLVASVIAGRDQAALMFAHDEFAYLPWRTALEVLPQTIAPGPLARALAVALGVVVAAVIVGVRASRGAIDPSVRGASWAALLLLVLGTLAPIQVPGWSYFSQRFFPLGVALLVAALPVESVAASRQRAAALGLFVAAVAWLVPSVPFHGRLASNVTDALAGLTAPVKRTRKQLPIPLAASESGGGLRAADEVPMMNPLLHMGALYAVAYGGMVPSVFTVSPAVHPFVRRAHAREPEWVSTPERYWGAVGSGRFQRDVSYRDGILNELASLGIFYEGVVLLGARPDDVALFARRGYVTDWHAGATTVGHFEPCRIDVAVAGPIPPGGASFSVTVSPYQLVSDVHPTPRVDAEGVSHFDLGPSPCGEVVIRTRGADDPAGREGLACKNADAHGDLTASVTRTAGRVDCDAR
jgi:hypothetical protein